MHNMVRNIRSLIERNKRRYKIKIKTGIENKTF